jgi:hypothetical protein
MEGVQNKIMQLKLISERHMNITKKNPKEK